MSAHPHAAGLFLIDDPRWRDKVFLGGLVLLVPVVGWPLVLGYRAALVRGLLATGEPTLPAWRGAFGTHLREGVKAIGVIFGFLAPLYVVLAVLALGRGYVPGEASAWLLVLFLALPILSTLSFPAACVLLTTSPPAWLSATECAAFLCAYAAAIFLVPAGFLRVSLTGRYVSAFAFWSTVPFVVRNLRAYLAAWWHAGLMSLAGHLAFPISPWGVVWAYSAIVFLFNELLLESGDAAPDCWLARARLEHRRPDDPRKLLSALRDGAGVPVTVVTLGPFSAPLPRLCASPRGG